MAPLSLGSTWSVRAVDWAAIATAGLVASAGVASAEESFGTDRMTSLGADEPVAPRAPGGSLPEDGATYAENMRGEAPPNGVALLITGGIFTGLGVVNLATSPICKTDLIPRSAQDPCFGLSLAVGGIFLAAGVPMLVVGAVQRGEYNDWKAGVAAGLFVDVRTNSATLTWKGAF